MSGLRLEPHIGPEGLRGIKMKDLRNAECRIRDLRNKTHKSRNYSGLAAIRGAMMFLFKPLLNCCTRKA